MVSTTNFIIAQVIGFIALILIVISFQLNNRKKLINVQGMANLCYSIQYVFLHAFSGAAVFIICTIRNYVFNRYKKVPLIWLVVTLTVIFSSLIFTYNGPMSLLPIVATCFYTTALWKGNLRFIRIADVVACLLFVVYTLRVSALMAFIATLLELFSVLLGIYRYDIKKMDSNDGLNRNKILEALKYYKVNNDKHKRECLKALRLINSNSKLRKKVLGIRNKLLFLDDDNKFNELVTKTSNELFGSDNKFITNVIILSGLDIHKNNIKDFDAEMIDKHILRINEGFNKSLDGMSVRQMIWLTHFEEGKIIEVGCLQFQITNILFHGANVKIHIPRDVDFSIDNVRDSINRSKVYIKRYYNINPKYYCDSWMLGKTTRKCLNKESNIYKFGDLFDIKENVERIDALRFIYGKIEEDYTKLEEKTTLQRKLKEQLLNGEKLYNGKGVLK